jgi:hypothetical protein
MATNFVEARREGCTDWCTGIISYSDVAFLSLLYCAIVPLLIKNS